MGFFYLEDHQIAGGSTITDKQGFISQMKTGVQNFVSEVKLIIERTKIFIGDIRTPKIKEVAIPEHWKDPSAVVPVQGPTAPVAVEPTIVYEQLRKPKLQIAQPKWFIKVKRIVVFVILLGTCASSIGLILTFPPGLLFTLPTLYIAFDYLVKTQPKAPTMRWDILPDIEKEDE